MGWLYSNDWQSIRDVKEHLKESNREILLDSGGSGSEFYMLIKTTDGGKAIILCLIRGDGHGTYGYKDIHEDAAPYYFSCPKRLLNQSTVMTERAKAWRQQCLVVQNERRARLAYVKSLSHGDKVCLNSEEKPVTFEYVHSNTFFVGTDAEGARYRFRIAHIKLPEATNDF